VHPLDAVAQLAVPLALRGVQPLQPLGTLALAAQLVHRAVALAQEPLVAGARDVAQLGGRLARLRALPVERPDGVVRAPGGAPPARQGGCAGDERPDDQDRGVTLAHVDGDARDPGRDEVDGYRGGGAGGGDPARPARACRSARMHGAASLDLPSGPRHRWADSVAGRSPNLSGDAPESARRHHRGMPDVPFSPVRTGSQAPFRRDER
jgi:hypothetical protein